MALFSYVVNDSSNSHMFFFTPMKIWVEQGLNKHGTGQGSTDTHTQYTIRFALFQFKQNYYLLSFLFPRDLGVILLSYGWFASVR